MSVQCPSCSFTFNQPSGRVDKWVACPRCNAAIPPVSTRPFRPWRAVLVTTLVVAIPLLLLKAMESPTPKPQYSAPKVVVPPEPEMSQRTKDTLAKLDELVQRKEELERMKKDAARQERVSEAERARLLKEIDDLVRETNEKRRQAIEKSKGN
jgi:hypothetical protein